MQARPFRSANRALAALGLALAFEREGAVGVGVEAAGRRALQEGVVRRPAHGDARTARGRRGCRTGPGSRFVPSASVDVEPRLLGVEAAAVVEVVDLLAVEPDGQRVVRADHHLRRAIGEVGSRRSRRRRRSSSVRVDLAQVDLPLASAGRAGFQARRLAPAPLTWPSRSIGPIGRDGRACLDRERAEHVPARTGLEAGVDLPQLGEDGGRRARGARRAARAPARPRRGGCQWRWPRPCGARGSCRPGRGGRPARPACRAWRPGQVASNRVSSASASGDQRGDRRAVLQRRQGGDRAPCGPRAPGRPERPRKAATTGSAWSDLPRASAAAARTARTRDRQRGERMRSAGSRPSP